MDPDPMQFVEEDNDKKEPETAAEVKKPKAHLNSWVAITVALLATFMGICKVKDDNIVQAMQQAQADKLDHWAFYQARNIRQEIAQAELTQLSLARGAQPAAGAAPRTKTDSAIARYTALVQDQATKSDSLRMQAEQEQKRYHAP